MTLSLLALFMLPICLALVLSPKNMHKVIKDWANSPALLFFSSLFLFLFALIIVISTGFNLRFWPQSGTADWAWNSQVILSWIAVLMGIKGLAAFFPKLVKWRMHFVTEELLPLFGFMGLLFWLGMVYLETQVF
ncbi:hypothetical protein IPG41_02365 [Candidatus Peregrinibacteria bacterium]|nr:MAG: hypothetical protein IPG41_02365 [Candidatus Peregrinibacteria bacterium]